MRSSSIVRIACVVGLASCGGGTPATKPGAIAVPARAMCKAAPAVLQVAWQSPRPGEKLHYERSSVYDLVTPSVAMKGTSKFVTDEVVTSVDRDAIDELQVTFVEGKYQPDLAKSLVEVTGTYRVRGGSDRKSVFSQGDAAPPEETLRGLRGYARGDVGQPHWILRLLTDRTFQVGRETVLPHQSVDGPEGEKVDVRVTLKSISGDTAMFVMEEHLWRGNRRIFVSRTNIAMDTVHARLLSVDDVTEPDLPPDVLEKAGVGGHIDTHEVFRYAFSTGGTPTPSASGCDQPPILWIAKHEEQIGDTYAVDQEMRMDETLRNEETSRSTRLRLAWTASTDQRVTDVRDGISTGIEIQVRKERLHDMTTDGSESPEVAHDGEVIAVNPTGAKSVITRNGIEISGKKDTAFEVAVGGMECHQWVNRIVTQRTFQLGVEQYFSSEVIMPLASRPQPVRIMLASIDGDVATFKLDMKTAHDVGVKPFPLFLRGTLTFDVKNARPLALHVNADFDTKDGVTKDGEFVAEYRFRYGRA